MGSCAELGIKLTGGRCFWAGSALSPSSRLGTVGPGCNQLQVITKGIDQKTVCLTVSCYRSVLIRSFFEPPSAITRLTCLRSFVVDRPRLNHGGNDYGAVKRSLAPRSGGDSVCGVQDICSQAQSLLCAQSSELNLSFVIVIVFTFEERTHGLSFPSFPAELEPDPGRENE